MCSYQKHSPCSSVKRTCRKVNRNIKKNTNKINSELDRGVSIYNNKKNATTQEKPIDAISNYGVVPINIKTRAIINGIQREGDQNSFPLGSFVRKFEHKSGISTSFNRAPWGRTR